MIFLKDEKKIDAKLKYKKRFKNLRPKNFDMSYFGPCAKNQVFRVDETKNVLII